MAGIYLHIPFCRKACTYCNFHFSTSLKLKQDFLSALLKEINSASFFSAEETHIETVYFGGGTPSMLSGEELNMILNAIKQKFIVNAAAEITLEANPDDITDETAAAWTALGFNRLSIGIQSFNEQELQWMNRAHNAQQARDSLDTARRAGFTNFSVDLIYGSPLQTEDDLQRNATFIFEKKIPHISCYALTVEPKTALDSMINNLNAPRPDPDKQARHFDLLLSLMETNGYEQYEISNFCIPGSRSRHNSSYWKGVPYYGFGPSAHSFNGLSERRWNVANNALYINSVNSGIAAFESECLTATQSVNEYIMTSMRTIEGTDRARIKAILGSECEQLFLKQAKKYLDGKLLFENNGNYILTRKGKFLADGIASDLFFV